MLVVDGAQRSGSGTIVRYAVALAAMCGATTEGLEVDSTEFTFVPGPRIAGGTCDWNIGTAGSTTMLAFSVLPLACFADGAVRARIEGGVFQDFAPSPYHFQHVLAVLLRRMGVVVHVEVMRPGYVPRGAGIIELTVTPASENFQSLTLVEPGVVREVRGIALASASSPMHESSTSRRALP